METVSCSRKSAVHGRSTRWICVLRDRIRFLFGFGAVAIEVITLKFQLT